MELRPVLAQLAHLTRLHEVFDEVAGLAVDDLVTALNGTQREGLGEVALADAGRSDGEDVLTSVDELEGGEFEDVALGQARVVAPVEVGEVFALGLRISRHAGPLFHVMSGQRFTACRATISRMPGHPLRG